MEKKKRGSFTGEIGFVLAAAGSAVGLGNLWRFPYLAAQYGGGIFILVYIILALTFGFTLMTTEIAIGRKTKLSPTRAYKDCIYNTGYHSAILLCNRRMGYKICHSICGRTEYSCCRRLIFW